ncbi:MAG: FecR family protein [Polyangiaceae bacterium]
MRDGTLRAVRRVGAPDEVVLRHTWSRIQSARRRQRRAVTSRVRWMAFAATLALGILSVVVFRNVRQGGTAASAPGTTTAATLVAELRTTTGAPLAAETFDVRDDEASRTVALGDGSKVVASPGTTLVPVANDATALRFRMDRGSAVFDVRPGGPRSWTIAAGSSEVRVLGTRFTVARSGTHVHVDVERGVVSVTDPRIDGGRRVLVAGESVDVDDGATWNVDDLPKALPTSRPRSAPPTAATGAADSGGRWRALWDAVDRARAERRFDDALRDLALLADDRTPDARAALAAFTAGKIELEERNDPRRAAEAFERCVALGAPAALDEDARVRAVEAWAKAGSVDEARAAAARYRAVHPHGRYAERIRPWDVAR